MLKLIQSIKVDDKDKKLDISKKDNENMSAYEFFIQRSNAVYKESSELWDELITNMKFISSECIQSHCVDRDATRIYNIHTFLLNPTLPALGKLDFISNDFKVIDASNFKEKYYNDFTTKTFENQTIISKVKDIIMNACVLRTAAYDNFKTFIEQASNTGDTEVLYDRLIDMISMVNAEMQIYGAAVVEFDNIIKSSTTSTITEAVDLEEDIKQYTKELKKLIPEIREFYDKFEYKDIIKPRKKKIDKMHDYMFGALKRKYTLRIPIYVVEGKSTDVKDIVENKFIKKIETITNKYPNFIVLSPNFDDDSDMYIYITLKEPFGEKEDRTDRVDQSKEKILTEAAGKLTVKERAEIPEDQFGVPSLKAYPLIDKNHIQSAITQFHNCKDINKPILARNIVKAIVRLDLVGKFFISPDNKYKEYFPNWLIRDKEPVRCEKVKNGYKIYKGSKKVASGVLTESVSSCGIEFII